MLFLSGCIGTVTAIVSTGINAGRLYVDSTKEKMVIRTAECGKIDPIYPSERFNERLTEDEKNQIFEQYNKLKKLCPEDVD